MSTQTPETFETFVTEDAQAQAYAMPEFENFDNLPDAPEAVQPKKAKENKRWFCRILAFLFAVAPIVIYFLLPIKHLVTKEGAYVFEELKFFDHMLQMIQGNLGTEKFFGILPMHLDPNGTLDMAVTAIMYLIPVSLVVCAIFGIIALFSKKAAPYCLRFITGTHFVMTMLYAITLVLIAAWYDPQNHEIATRWQDGLDYVVLGMAAACFLVYVIASFVKAGKWALLDLIIFLLTAASVGGVAYGLISNPEVTRGFLTGDASPIYGTITLALIAADMFFLICAWIGISAKKLYGIDVVRAVFMTLVGGFLLVLCFLVKEPDLSSLMLPSIIAAASAFVMLIIEAITIGVRNSKKKKAAKAAKAAAMEEVAEAPEFEAVEETVAQPFETEAVAEVEETAVEAVAEVAPEEAVPFDPFLETLSKEERKQFGELTINIQKIEGMPRFEAGGDNKVFFRKIFVNLGSIRGLVPDGLMEKIYQFTIRL